MAAGALMLAGVLQDVGLDPEHRVPHKVWYLMPVIPMLFLAAVAGLFSRRYPGWLAKAGLMLALLGAAASTLALVIWGWFGKTSLAYGISVLGMAVLSAGVGVFGIGAVRHKVLPRWNALPLIIGLLCGLTLVFGRLAPWAPTAILALYACAWIALGYVLWSDSRRVEIMSTATYQYVLPKWRSVVSAIGLGAAVAEALLWVALHAIWIGGFQTDLGVEWVRYNLEAEGFRPVLFWWRIGVWLGVLPIVASSLGKGWLRKWGLIVGLVTFWVWLVRGHS